MFLFYFILGWLPFKEIDFGLYDHQFSSCLYYEIKKPELPLPGWRCGPNSWCYGWDVGEHLNYYSDSQNYYCHCLSGSTSCSLFAKFIISEQGKRRTISLFFILLYVQLLFYKFFRASNNSSFFQAFPEALFYQLLPAMVHPDHETRVGAHQIFSVVLVPSSVCPNPSTNSAESRKAGDLPRALSRTVSVFSSSAALFDKLRRDKTMSRDYTHQDNRDNIASEGQPRNSGNGGLNRLKSSYSRAYSRKASPASAMTDGNSMSDFKTEPVSLHIFMPRTS